MLEDGCHRCYRGPLKASRLRKEVFREKLDAFKLPLRFEAYPLCYRIIDHIEEVGCGES
jgi:hypothetical protein